MLQRSFTAVYKYQLNKLKFLPFAVLAAIIAMTVMEALVIYYMDGAVSVSDLMMSGVDTLAGAAILGVGLAYGTDFYNTACANGSSRRTTVFAAFCSMITAGAAMSLMLTLLTEICGIFMMEAEWTIGAFYGFEDFWINNGGTMVGYILQRFLIGAFSIAAAGMTGFAIASLFYRLSRTVKIVLLIGVFMFGPAGFGIIVGYLEEAGYDVMRFIATVVFTVMKIFGCYVDDTFTGNMLQGSAMFLLLCAVLVALSWLFAFRATAKPIEIRSE